MSASPPYPQMGPHTYSLSDVEKDAGWSLPPCGHLECASLDEYDSDPDLPRLLSEARRAFPC